MAKCAQRIPKEEPHMPIVHCRREQEPRQRRCKLWRRHIRVHSVELHETIPRRCHMFRAQEWLHGGHAGQVKKGARKKQKRSSQSQSLCASRSCWTRRASELFGAGRVVRRPWAPISHTRLSFGLWSLIAFSFPALLRVKTAGQATEPHFFVFFQHTSFASAHSVVPVL